MSMQTLLALDLPTHPVNAAIDDIIAAARELTDQSGVPLFTDFDRGGDMLTGPPAEWPISGRIWHDSLSGQSESVQMFVASWEVVVSIYLYFNVPTDDTHQHGFQTQREAFCRYLIDRLEHPDLNDSGMAPTAAWRFVLPTGFDIDHTAPYKRFSSYVTIVPPLYVSRIDFKIQVWDTDRSAS
jgi:hypothetical protein